jgi:hypothetical protein
MVEVICTWNGAIETSNQSVCSEDVEQVNRNLESMFVQKGKGFESGGSRMWLLGAELPDPKRPY